MRDALGSLSLGGRAGGPEGSAQTRGAGHETLNVGGAVVSLQVSCPQGAAVWGRWTAQGHERPCALFPEQVMELVLFMEFVGRLQGAQD